MKVYQQQNKKEIFAELSDEIYLKDVVIKDNTINEAKLSSFKNILLIETLKTLRIIELDDLESFLSYINYDHFLIFKYKEDFYFCDTELVPKLGKYSMLKMTDYHLYLRKEKLNKISQI
jgi:hypothetical protein